MAIFNDVRIVNIFPFFAVHCVIRVLTISIVLLLNCHLLVPRPLAVLHVMLMKGTILTLTTLRASVKSNAALAIRRLALLVVMAASWLQIVTTLIIHSLSISSVLLISVVHLWGQELY